MKKAIKNILLLSLLLSPTLIACDNNVSSNSNSINEFVEDDDPTVVEFKILSQKDVKTEYNAGDMFDPTNLLFYAKWSHDVEEDDLTYLDVDYEQKNRALTKDDKEIIFTYENKTCSLKINVKDISIANLTIDRSRIGEIDILGNTINLLNVSASADIDGTSTIIDSSKLTFLDNGELITTPSVFVGKKGIHEITVEYINLKSTFQIEIVDELDDLIVDRINIPFTCANNTIVDLSKVIITAKVKNKTLDVNFEKVTFKDNNVEISNARLFTVTEGKHEITVSYLNKSVTFEISTTSSIEELYIDREIISEYIAINKVIDLTKIKITAKSGSEIIDIDTSLVVFTENNVAISNATKYTVTSGIHTLTISYLEKNCTFTFTGIEQANFIVYKLPNKTTEFGNFKYDGKEERVTNFKDTGFEQNGSYFEILETKINDAAKLGQYVEIYLLRGQYYIRNMDVKGQKVRFHINSNKAGKANLSLFGCSNIFESWNTQHLSKILIKDAFKLTKVTETSSEDIVINDNSSFPEVNVPYGTKPNDIFNNACVETILAEVDVVEGDNIFDLEVIMEHKKGVAGVAQDPYYSGAVQYRRTANIAGMQIQFK